MKEIYIILLGLNNVLVFIYLLRVNPLIDLKNAELNWSKININFVLKYSAATVSILLLIFLLFNIPTDFDLFIQVVLYFFSGAIGNLFMAYGPKWSKAQLDMSISLSKYLYRFMNVFTRILRVFTVILITARQYALFYPVEY